VVTAASSYLLPRLLGYSRAVALLLTGGTYSPDSPLLQGLYHGTFPNREDVFPAALGFARELAANTSQTSIAWTKALLWRGADSIEGQHILDSRGISDLASRGDAAEGALSFKERRPVEFKDVLSKDLSAFIPWVCQLALLMPCFPELMVVSNKWTELDVRQRKAKL
jgi:enoyl-CoA hydratase/carnithine racemase